MQLLETTKTVDHARSVIDCIVFTNVTHSLEVTAMEGDGHLLVKKANICCNYHFISHYTMNKGCNKTCGKKIYNIYLTTVRE